MLTQLYKGLTCIGYNMEQTITFYVTNEQKEALVELAIKRGLMLSSLCRSVLIRELEVANGN